QRIQAFGRRQQPAPGVDCPVAALPEVPRHVLPAGLHVGDGATAVAGVWGELVLVEAGGLAVLGQQPAQSLASSHDLAGVDHGSPPLGATCCVSTMSQTNRQAALAGQRLVDHLMRHRIARLIVRVGAPTTRTTTTVHPTTIACLRYSGARGPRARAGS